MNLTRSRSRPVPSEPSIDGRERVGLRISGLRKRFGDHDVLRGADLVVEPGSMVALLGPSGCGKTTLLRTVAGLEAADDGEVVIGDRVVASPTVAVAPERRRVGMVFQDWALFPHLSVARNVGYGLPRRLRASGKVDDALGMVGLAGMGDRAPATLSGGQQQRVALARALAPEPAVLLLDEPFSNLDTTLRSQVRLEVHRLLTDLGVTTVFVTHDQEEAFLLGAEVAVMDQGRIVQQASPAELYAVPATPWVASFVGDANLVPGEAADRTAHTEIGPVPLSEATDGPVRVVLRPEELRVRAGDDAEVELVEFYGHDTVYVVRADGGLSLRVRAGSAPEFARGDRVSVTYDGPATIVFAL